MAEEGVGGRWVFTLLFVCKTEGFVMEGWGRSGELGGFGVSLGFLSLLIGISNW
jgi:hypothetical protein